MTTTVGSANAPLKRVPLCEGLEGYDVPIHAAYVRQGSKVWVAWSDEKTTAKLDESVANGATLVESISDLTLIEDASGSLSVKDGVWVLEGPAQRSNVRNANRRRYSRKIWERIVADPKSPQQSAIKARAMIGHLEHPKDGRTDGNLGALVVTSSELREDGVVWNTFELLDTPAGKILQEYTKKKVRWGVSSRGNGTVSPDGDVNEDDFVLETWDAVMRPSTPGAFPSLLPEVKPKAKKAVSESDEANDPLALYVKLAAVPLDKVPDKALHAASIAESLSAVAALSEQVGADKVQPVIHSLADVMKALATQSVEGATANIVESATAQEEARKGYAKIIEAMRSKVTSAVTETTKIRAELDTLKAQLTTAINEKAQALKQAKQLEIKLDIATATVSEMATKQVKTGVATATDELIESFPALHAHRGDLLVCESPVDVLARATGLLSLQGAFVATPTPILESEAQPFPKHARIGSEPFAKAKLQVNEAELPKQVQTLTQMASFKKP